MPGAMRHPRARSLVAFVLVAGFLACAMPWLRAVAADLSAPALAQRINPSPMCTMPVVIGLCWCGTTPCGYRLRMYVPTAFVETVRRPGDSLLAPPGFAPGAASGGGAALPSTISSALSATDNTAEAHVWTLNDQSLLLSKLLPCLTCRPSDAQAPATPSPAPDRLVSCDPSGQIASAMLGASSRVDIPGLPSLTYATELDLLHWRTGCRDLSIANQLRANGLVCTAAGIAQWIYGDNPLSRLVGADACVGSWGPLYPRQMRDIGPTPVVHSAKTAYRALSLARADLGLLPVPVDLGGRLQQAWPAVSACFGVGELPLPEPGWSPQPTMASPDGRYGWFYWRQTTCCVSFATVSSCLSSRRRG